MENTQLSQRLKIVTIISGAFFVGEVIATILFPTILAAVIFTLILQAINLSFTLGMLFFMFRLAFGSGYVPWNNYHLFHGSAMVFLLISPNCLCFDISITLV